MRLALTDPQRRELALAATAEKGVRRWRRDRAVLLRGEGLTVAAVARTLRCSHASVYAWTAAWRKQGVAGLPDGERGGRPRTREGSGAAVLTDLLAADPQARGHRATDWTVPLLRTELAQAGYVVGGRTIRRALHRLGYRWQRPRYGLGRPDPDYVEKRGP